MWGLLLLLIVAVGLACVVGGLQAHGVVWAYQICAATFGLCDHADQLAIATGCLALAWLLLRYVRA